MPVSADVELTNELVPVTMRSPTLASKESPVARTPTPVIVLTPTPVNSLAIETNAPVPKLTTGSWTVPVPESCEVVEDKAPEPVTLPPASWFVHAPVTQNVAGSFWLLYSAVI